MQSVTKAESPLSAQSHRPIVRLIEWASEVSTIFMFFLFTTILSDTLFSPMLVPRHSINSTAGDLFITAVFSGLSDIYFLLDNWIDFLFCYKY